MIELTPPQLRFVALGVFSVALLALTLYARRRRRVARTLGDAVVIRQLLGTDLGATPWGRLVPIALAAAALSFALLDPSLAASRTPASGPVILLLDASGSMLVDDPERPRLEIQRDFARSLVAELPGVPIGIVAFSGRAFSLTPPTRDRGAIEMYLAVVDPTIVTQTGSGFAAAIRQGVGLLGTAGERGGTLVLMGDGDETEDREATIAAAALASRRGITIHTVGVGTPDGGPVPAFDLTTGSTRGFLLGPGGQPLMSRLDEVYLRSIADRARGVYIRADEPGGARAIREAIRLEPAAPEAGDGTVPTYVWFAGAALLLLLAEPVTARSGRDR